MADNSQSTNEARERRPGDLNDASASEAAGPDTRPAVGSDSSEPGSPLSILFNHLKQNKLEFLLFITRTLTVLGTLAYIVGYPEPASKRFKQALLMTGATSSLRLHQRMPPPPLNQLGWQYFMNLIKEDAFHYLLFPFLFFFGQPIALVLLPCSLYAIFNLARYAIQILEKLGNHEQLRLTISNTMTTYQRSLLQLIALSEVSLMAVVVIGVFTRVCGLMTPLLYYRFLMLRYNSSRNAHLKLLVTQIRDTVIHLMNRNRH